MRRYAFHSRCKSVLGLYGFYNQHKSSRLRVERHRLVGLVYGGISVRKFCII
nr:MAG TPA: hypothetical protein [Caudoviricetes sp.]